METKDKTDIYTIKIKRGMKFKLAENEYNDYSRQGAKAGDVVKITSVTACGYPSDGTYNDYENLRVSNGKFSWRISRDDLEVI
jgi:hypothetical protein